MVKLAFGMIGRYYRCLVLSAIWAVLCFACVICGCSHSVDSRLKTAESLIEERPDSALSILSGIDADKFSNSEDIALYGLLYTQALDKNHLSPADDSVISQSVDYYDKHNDRNHLLKSTYFMGRAQFLKQRYSSAIVSFYKALRLAEEMDDDYWAGMSCRGIADIHNQTFNTSDEVIFAKKELKHLQKSGRQPYLDYALIDYSRALLNDGQTINLYNILKQAEDSAKMHNDLYLLKESRKLKSKALIRDNDYERAFPIIEEICSTPYAEYEDSLLLALALVGTNQVEKADKLISLIGKDGVPLVHVVNYNICKKNGDHYKAIIEMEHLDSIDDERLKQGISHSLSNSLSDYFETERLVTKAEMRAYRMTMLTVILVVIIVIGILFIVGNNYIQKQNRKIEEKVRLADCLQKELSETKHNNLKIHEIKRLLLTDNLQVLDSFSKIMIETTDTKKAMKKTAEAVEKLLEELSVCSNRTKKLEEKVDIAYNNLFSDFRKDFPLLKDADYLLFLYSILNISNSTMSVILKEDKIEAIYNRKRRLKDKIKSLEESKRVRYLMYI